MEHKDESRTLTFREQWSALRFIFQFTKRQRSLFLLALLSGFFLAVVNVAQPFILKQFLDVHLAKEDTTMKVIFFFAGLYLISSFFKAIFWFGQWFLFEMGIVRTQVDTRNAVYKKIHTLGMRYFDQKSTGWLITRITNDTNLFEFWFVFLMLATGIFSVFSAFVGLFALDKQIAAVMLLFLPVLLLAIYLYQHFSSSAYQQMRGKLSDLNTKLNEYISGMKIIQQFNQEERLQKSFEETNEEYLAMRRKVIKINSLLLNSFVGLLNNFGVIIVLALFSIRSFEHLVVAGVVYAFVTNVQQLFQPISNLMEFLATFSDGLVASHRIRQIMNETELAPQQNENASEEIEFGKIEFQNVSFSYDGENKILKNISFTIQPGETFAFVGHTGSGKSSIINVFMRFYEFYEGKILIDDKDIRDFPIEDLRKKIGLVLQDAFLFVGDIKSNIRLMNETISDAEIIRAAQFTQAHHFIEGLEEGYNAEVIERGDSFSSGQRQLLNFARTIVTNPKILVLDEATANIDTETESMIQKGLENMRKNRTTIAIAHRLSTIQDANQILVMDKGEIKERGTHEELLAVGGLYAQMYQLQVEKKSERGVLKSATANTVVHLLET
ncbi:ATP-binding cassette, subfamily B [Pilibacter termitis]|uniref:ATP-binding cassette, subfamily B n=1 Tax=Pilibacter termitis TaxID=263852 RepID=A0A1T4NQI5_9ENTE|nr:ABC transporter ATP-binding protein [Pilibacter termitis]SJZ81469.1 ATP-binding cassette, subfamily B [Pilibacter termitis]